LEEAVWLSKLRRSWKRCQLQCRAQSSQGSRDSGSFSTRQRQRTPVSSTQRARIHVGSSAVLTRGMLGRYVARNFLDNGRNSFGRTFRAGSLAVSPPTVRTAERGTRKTERPLLDVVRGRSWRIAHSRSGSGHDPPVSSSDPKTVGGIGERMAGKRTINTKIYRALRAAGWNHPLGFITPL
jgi:hypothetical protein